MADATKGGQRGRAQGQHGRTGQVKASGKSTVYGPARASASLKKAMFPVHKQMSSRIGEETIQDIYKATNFDPHQDVIAAA
jgi:C4-dicarboxylate-binding protein DctP